MNIDDIRTTMSFIIEAKAGNKQALEELCRRYMSRIHRLARLRLGPQLRQRMDSMDISQEAIIRVLLSVDKFEFRNDSSFLNWVSKLVENAIRDQAELAQAAKRDIRKEVAAPIDATQVDPFLEVIAINPEISQQLQLKDDLVRLEKAMDKLENLDREVVSLRNYAEMPFKEIADELHCSTDAARMRYVRAMDRLTDLMAK